MEDQMGIFNVKSLLLTAIATCTLSSVVTLAQDSQDSFPYSQECVREIVYKSIGDDLVENHRFIQGVSVYRIVTVQATQSANNNTYHLEKLISSRTYPSRQDCENAFIKLSPVQTTVKSKIKKSLDVQAAAAAEKAAKLGQWKIENKN